jgi:hypothetical protein
MNDQIKQAIADLDKQKHNPTPVLQIPVGSKPKPDEWGKVVKAINEAGFDVIEQPAWGRRDEFSVMCRRKVQTDDG